MRGFRVIVLMSLFVNLPKAGWSQKQRLDSLYKLLGSTGQDSNRLNLYENLAHAYHSVNTDSFFAYCNKGLALAKTLNSKKGIAAMYMNMASMLTDTGNFALARNYAEESLTINLGLKNPADIITSLTIIGRVYDFQSDFVEAAKYYSRAMQMAEESKNHEQTALVGTNLAAIYFNQQDYSKSEHYALQAMSEGKLANVPVHEYKGLEILAAVKAMQKDTNSAINYDKMAIELASRSGLLLSEAEATTDLARLQRDDREQLALLSKSRQIYDQVSPGSYESLDNWWSLAETYIRLSKSNAPAKDRAIFLTKADDCVSTMIKKCKESNNIPSLAGAYSLKASVAALKGNYKDAYEFTNLYHSINDSIFSQEKKNKIAEAMNKTAMDQKNAELAINQLTISNQRKQQLFLFSAVAMLIAIGALFYNQSRTRAKTNKTLLRLNKELDEANKLKARFFGILSHDLRSPIANLINFLQLQKRKPGLLTLEQIAERELKISNAAKTLLDTMESMLLWSKGQMEQFKPNFSLVRVSELFKAVDRQRPEEDPIQFNFSDPDSLELETDKDYLLAVMHNLTANARNATRSVASPVISWKAWQQDGQILLAIADNGPGTNQDQLHALFDETASTGGKKGLGLHIIRDLAKAIECHISFSADSDSGVCFTLRLNKTIPKPPIPATKITG